MSGLSVRYLEDGLLVTDTDGWGWWRLALVPYEFLDDSRREGLAVGAAGALAGLGETSGHLLVVRRRQDPNTWAEQLTGASGGGPAWATYVEALRSHVEGRAPLRPAPAPGSCTPAAPRKRPQACGYGPGSAVRKMSRNLSPLHGRLRAFG